MGWLIFLKDSVTRDLLPPQGLEGPPACGINARRFERQMGVRKSTTTTAAHDKAARWDEAQLCSVLHAVHYRA
jgi:hypothetical protein